MTTGKTTTDDTVGWQKGPMDRGTVTLIWGCVTTIFACSWTILHLNVPALTDSAWTRILRKTKWMAITIIFPEFILSKAICDLRLALQELCEFDEYLQSDDNKVKWRASYDMEGRSWEDEWSWKVEYPRHARLIYRLLFLKPPVQNLGETLPSPSQAESVGMESNTLHNNEGEQEQGEREQLEPVEEETCSPQHPKTGSTRDLEAQGSIRGSSDHGRDPTPSDRSVRSLGRKIDSTHPKKVSRLQRRNQVWTVVHSYFAQMGGLVYIDKFDMTIREHDYQKAHKHSVLTASKLTTRYIWPNTHPLQHLVLGKHDIEDKSKADSFVKSIAVLQITWLIFNVIARAIKKLPITQIEIATIAFAVMAIFTYAINWWKPKDVSQPIRLLPSLLGRSRKSDLMQSFMTRLRQPHQAAKDSQEISEFRRVPNDWPALHRLELSVSNEDRTASLESSKLTVSYFTWNSSGTKYGHEILKNLLRCKEAHDSVFE
ncbi:uncharacterized protein FIESC28_04708 [Fusarium coffeatum]|uniref:Uncharacterized protein n=1 Tax=Fusarium coffeatum TaxID=231269 RepID=A0A366RZT0_9HYPO|nr:uncharacterized protein FIESC28_04708 [Fusarium coffeatum]RBR21865.1 hypothetical protein FIESC28_04708 [Fusarium coffeatum]